MLVSFSKMGNSWVAFKALLMKLGFDVVVPPEITKKTINLGLKNSPETVCFPFKASLGSMIEVLDQGVEGIVMVSTEGPCRFGEYHRIQETILRKMGYDFEMIVINQNRALDFRSDKSPYKKLMSYHGATPGEVWEGIRLFYNKAWALKEVEKLRNYNRVYGVEKGKSDLLFDEFINNLDKADTVKSIKLVVNDYRNKYNSLDKRENRDAIKIGLIGEIYVTAVPYVNLNAERILADLGVEVYSHSTIFDWINVRRRLPLVKRAIGELGNKYLKYHIGGSEGIRTITSIRKIAKENYDGVLHLYPFACMPEVTVKSIIPRLSRDCKIPILSLNLDEQTGRAGFVTRIEAFVDMIRRLK